jgi:hypothetical protein
MAKKKFFIGEIVFILFVMFGALAQAQNPVKTNFTLTGTVTDSNTGERIPYAAVSVEGSSTGTTTDVNGYFILEKTPSDTVTIAVRYLGYRTKVLKLTPSADNQPIAIRLEEQSTNLSEVVVVARYEDKAMQHSVEEQKIKMSPSVGVHVSFPLKS